MSGEHWTPAKKRRKKHLEYLPERTSLRRRNRPDMIAPRRLERQKRPSQRLAAQALSE